MAFCHKLAIIVSAHLALRGLLATSALARPQTRYRSHAMAHHAHDHAHDHEDVGVVEENNEENDKKHTLEVGAYTFTIHAFIYILPYLVLISCSFLSSLVHVHTCICEYSISQSNQNYQNNHSIIQSYNQYY